MLQNLPDIVARLITEDTRETRRYFAAVAVANYRGKWLLGLSKARDDRYFRWTFAGGGLEDGESPEAAAVRECYEETNAKAKATGKAFELTGKHGVAFVPCRITTSPRLKSKADEFVCLGLFKESELKRLKTYDNVHELIRLARSHL